VADAKAGAIRLAAEQLLLLRRQRAAWRTHLDDLLRAEEAQPDGAVLLSLPGADACLAGRILGGIGADHERFATAGALHCYAGTAPVTKASGRSRAVVARFACNRFLRQAQLRWAMCSLRVSPWARVLRRQAGGGANPLLGAPVPGQPVAGGPAPPAAHGPALRRGDPPTEPRLRRRCGRLNTGRVRAGQGRAAAPALRSFW
jgi:hypothetical protein